MWYCLILVMVLYKELKYLEYQYAQMSSYQLPKIMTSFLMLPSVNENYERESNPMPKQLYLHLFTSAFLVSFTDPNKQFFYVRSEFRFLNHGFRV